MSAIDTPNDVIVLGAGIAGVSAAAHLLQRGQNVVLVDRRGPGEETSYGNLGMVEADGFVPVSFPTSIPALLRYAMNREPEVNYHPLQLLKLAPWLYGMFRASLPEQRKIFAKNMHALEQFAVGEHLAFAKLAGSEHLFRDTGWVRFFRSEETFAGAAEHMEFGDQYGANYEVLSAQELNDLEPHIKPLCHRAIWWKDSFSASDPGAVTNAIATHFTANGGRFVKGDAKTLCQKSDQQWDVDTEEGTLSASKVVVALGPWSMDILRPLGYNFPLAIKRGYHKHYRPRGNATLSRVIVDSDMGYGISPMAQGIRLTTGIEFAHREAEPTPVQLERTLKYARDLFPLGEDVEDEPWKGNRPCFPDSFPIVDQAPNHKGLWLDFGHGHTGFTLGPVTGRLLAEMMTGEKPIADPTPYRADRF